MIGSISFSEIFRGGSSVRRRALFGIFANAVGKFWTVLVQLLFLAILPRTWGGAEYGTWVVLSALPAYIALADLGFGSAASSEMTQKFSGGDLKAVERIFQSSWILITGSTAALILLLATISFSMMAFGLIAVTSETLWTVIALAGASFFSLQANVIQSGYRSTGRYAFGTLFRDSFIVIEGAAVVGSVIAGGGFIAAAVAMLIVRAVGAAACYLLLCRFEPWFRLGTAHADRMTMRRLVRPAMASMSLMVSGALSIQGVVIMLGLFASPAVAAVYASTRTLCRLPLQLSDLVGRATLPELSIAHARRDRRLFDRVTLLNVGAALVVALPLCLVIAAAGPAIALRISGGALRFDHLTFVALALAALSQALWTAVGQSLQATNQHHFFSYFYLALAAVQAVSPALLGRWSQTPAAVAFVVAVCEGLTLVAALRGWGRQRTLFLSADEAN